MKLYFYIFLLISSVVFSQNTVQGTVNFEGQPFEMVNVYLKGTTKGSVTNSEGHYSLKNIADGKYTLIFSSVGFITQYRKISVANSQTIITDINLQEDQSQLEEIVVSGTLKPVKKLDSPVPVEVYSPTFFSKNPAPSIFESMENINGCLLYTSPSPRDS